jgi:hypothetical protein
MDASVVSGLVAAASAVVAIALSYYFRRVSIATTEKVSALTERVSGLDRSQLGAVVCDFVDAGTLSTLATQYGVEPRPEEVETAEGVKRDAGAEAGVSASKLRVGGERSETLRALYRVRFDPHVLTEEVLSALDRQMALRSDLTGIPAVGLDELRALAGDDSGMLSVEEIWDRMVATAKAKQFEAAARADDYLLLNGQWLVNQGGSDEVELGLAELREGDTTSEMPRGVSLIVPVLLGPVGDSGDAILTAQGRQRLKPGTRLRASVFGRSASYQSREHSLRVIPVAVFSRVGGRASGGHGGGTSRTSSS